MTEEDYALSQNLENVILELLTNSLFLNFILNKKNLNLIQKDILTLTNNYNEDAKKRILFHIFDNSLLWAKTVYDYGIKNNCKFELDKKLTTFQNLNKTSINTVVEISSNFFVEFCCPTTKK